MNGLTNLMKTLLLKGRGRKMPKSQTVSVSVVHSLLVAERGDASPNFAGYFGTTSTSKETLLPSRGWE